MRLAAEKHDYTAYLDEEWRISPELGEHSDSGYGKSVG